MRAILVLMICVSTLACTPKYHTSKETITIYPPEGMIIDIVWPVPPVHPASNRDLSLYALALERQLVIQSGNIRSYKLWIKGVAKIK